MIILSEELNTIQSLLHPGEQVFLVGGAVRDSLLSKPNQDLDFVCADDPRIISRKLADKLSGAFFMLDTERGACRVIAKNDKGERLIFDFTQMRGQNLNDDLLERDFTINAMAVDLNNPDEVIDPLQGRSDLRNGWLRPCKSSSFDDDPLRAIRAIRYSVKYNLNIETATLKLIENAVNKLSCISKERKRDELFKILETENPWTALELCSKHGIFSHLSLDCIHDLKRAFSRLKVLYEMTASLFIDKQLNFEINHSKSLFRSINSSTLISLRDHFSIINQSERSIQALNGIISLLWGLSESDGAKVAETLALSNEEQEQIINSLRNQSIITDQFNSQGILDRRFIYRYFQCLDVVGLDVAILTLAEAALVEETSNDEEKWSALILFCQKLVETWFMNPEYVNPKLFLTGRDLMFEFDIPQGPQIGQLLDGLREEQAIGSLQNRTQALAWVDSQLQKGFLEK